MAVSKNAFRDIFGDAFNNDLIGSGLNERLFGDAGNDRLYAQGGYDQLFGGTGNDLLDGGTGADTMFGGAGNDIYRVDDPRDLVSEETTAGVDDGGTDYVQSSISYKLGNFLENLELTGSGNINGAGNALANTMKGNAGRNVLFGGDGSDILYGYDGDDVLIGGEGKDYLYGGAGADVFVFAPEPSTWNRIYDFGAGDKIGIYAAAFGLSEGAGLTGGLLNSGYFVLGATPTAAHGQFLLRTTTSTTELMWDPDGTGSARAYNVTYLPTGTVLSAADIIAYGDPAATSVAISAVDAGPRAENSGSTSFAVTLSQALNQDVTIVVGTQSGTAVAGVDFVPVSSQTVTITAGSTVGYVTVDLLDDNLSEGAESFSLTINSAFVTGSGAPLTVSNGTASAVLADEGPMVVGDHFTIGWGAWDPAGIIFNPLTGGLLISDSEVEELTSPSQNLFSVTLDGSLISSLTLPFTDEPTGLALDAANGLLFISDDDQYKVFAVSIDDPTTVLWDFDTLPIGGTDPEDIAFDSDTGHLFIVNGTPGNTIVETDIHGTTVFNTITLPSVIGDPEALAYDPSTDLFYVGGGFSDSIFVVDHAGNLVNTITLLQGARAAGTNHRVSVKDLTFAPASDGSGETHLYVADYGWSHYNDGRVIEIDLGDGVVTGGDWLLA